MKVLIDTNVILDVMTGREPHVKSSSAFLKLCGIHITGMITVSQTTDIFYILRREGNDVAEVKSVIRKLAQNVKVLDVFAADAEPALDSEMPDYEDALLAYSAKRYKADFIITRNEKDFVKAPIPALTPQDFMDKYV